MGLVEVYSLYSLIYLIPGCLFYIAFLYHLFTKNSPETKTPFFKIIKISGFIDLLEIIFSSVFTRMGSVLAQVSFFLPLGSSNAVLTLIIYAMLVFAGAQAWLQVVIAFNRLTAILFPMKYNSIWKGKNFFGIILLSLIIPGIWFSWVLIVGSALKHNTFFYIIDTFKTGIEWFRKATFVIGSVGITSILTLIFNSVTFILLRRGHLIISNKNKYKQEFRLLTISFAFFIVHALFLGNAVLTFYFAYTEPTVVVIIHQIAVDIQSLISPFCILLLTKDLRHSFFGLDKTRVLSVPSNNSVPHH